MQSALSALGWSVERQRELDALGADLIPARISAVEISEYHLAGVPSLDRARITGRLRRERGDDPPVTGDWVALERGRIAHVLSRSSTLSRRSVDKSGRPQLAAANLDQVLIVTAAGSDLSARRIERYLALVYEGGARPIIVINKSDLVEDPLALVQEIEPSAAGVPIAVTSAERPDGIDTLRPHLAAGETIAIVGSSGVGKSSLTNRLLEAERQPIQAVRASDQKGRHTTVKRELFVAPSGVLIIDTPGVREVGLTAMDDGLDLAFSDVTRLAAECRFRDCTHGTEPRCAVRAAVEVGELDDERFESYRKLEQESDRAARDAEKKRWAKSVAKSMKAWKKLNR